MENRKARAARPVKPSGMQKAHLGRTGPTTGRNAKRGQLKVAATLGERLQFALEAYGWVVFVADDYEIVFEMEAAAAFELGAQNPLAAD